MGAGLSIVAYRHPGSNRLRLSPVRTKLAPAPSRQSMIYTARIAFDWEKRWPPERMSFGFFFKPILPRLRPCWWVCGYWPLAFPASDHAKLALEMIEDDVTPPDTVLPECAFEIIGDRNQFYGLLDRPWSASVFEDDYRAATRRDQADWDRLFGPLTVDNAARHMEQLIQHAARHGCHTSRFLDEYPVEFAFMTNDTVWWMATRQPEALDELTSYAAHIPGLSFRRTAFGL
jgi:hypothetical protein